MERKSAFALACLAFALHARSLGYGFINGDDYAFILENPVINGHAGFLSLWSDPVNHLYAPLSYSLWYLVSAVFGTKAWAFHALSALLHAASTAVVYLIAVRVLRARSAPQAGVYAALGALVFAFHPVQVEAVSWASEAKDLLFTLLSLLSIHTYLLSAEARETLASIESAAGDRKRLKAKDSLKAEASSSRATKLYASAFALFVLALLAKPAAVVVPAILLVLDAVILERPWRRSLQSLWPWFGAAAVFSLATAAIQPAADIAHTTPLWFRPLVALDTIAVYLGHVLLPLQLGADYGRTPGWLLDSGAYRITAPVAAVVLAASGACLLRPRLRWVAGVIAIFVLGFLPVSGLVSFDYQQYTTVTDHYLYLPMFGVALGVALALEALHASKAALAVGGVLALAVGGVLALALAALSLPLSATWHDNHTLYDSALALNPRSFLSYNNLGQAFEAEGKLEQALESYRLAIKAKPAYLAAENNIGNVLINQGKTDEAIAHYARVISTGEITDPPGHTAARIYNNYAAALAKRGRLPEAMTAVQRAIEIDPDFADARANLRTLSAAMGAGGR